MTNIPRPSEEPSADALMQKVIRGEPLTPSQSHALQRVTGVWVEPAAAESAPEPASSPVQVPAIAIRTRSAAKEAVDASAGRHDATDLVTGKCVVNIYPRSVPDALGHRLVDAVKQVCAVPAHAIADIQQITDAIERHLLPGFSSSFTAEEVARFARADAGLRQRVSDEFHRMLLGSRVEEMIGKLDSSLRSEIRPSAARIDNSEMQACVADALGRWESNIRSPYRNFYYRTDRTACGNPQLQREYGLPLLARGEFSVALMDEFNAPGNTGAGYEALCRMLFLRDPRGNASFVHCLTAVHELVHVAQHERYVAGARDEEELALLHAAYTESMTEGEVAGINSAHGILEDECESFAAEIELLFARIGFGRHMVGNVLKQLGMDPADEAAAQHILQLMTLAQSYYAGGGRTGDAYPPAYVKEIRDLYTRLGITLHRYGPDGRVVRDA